MCDRDRVGSNQEIGEQVEKEVAGNIGNSYKTATLLLSGNAGCCYVI